MNIKQIFRRETRTAGKSSPDIHKLRRVELLEIMYELSEENDSLKQENAALKEELQRRIIRMEQAGSIAEAALQLQDIFTAAQKAADQYVESVAQLHQNLDTETCREDLQKGSTAMVCRKYGTGKKDG